MIGGVSYVVAIRAQKRPKVGGDIVLVVSFHKVVWIQATSYASVESCEREWRRLNGEMDEENELNDYVPDAIRWSCYSSVTPVGSKTLVLFTPVC